MFHIDKVIALTVNQYSQQSWLFDHTMAFLQRINLVKGGVFMALFWGVWFYSGRQPLKAQREIILAVFTGALLALALARLLAIILPFQLRPAHDLAPIFRLPFGVHTALKGWSSFPSDHAALFAALTTGLWFISRRLAVGAAVYTFTFILLPRIYCGYHYPSDIIAGAFLGIASTTLMCKLDKAKTFFGQILAWSEKYPGTFYCGAFLFTYQLATLFDDLRDLGSGIIKIVHLYHGSII